MLARQLLPLLPKGQPQLVFPVAIPRYLIVGRRLVTQRRRPGQWNARSSKSIELSGRRGKWYWDARGRYRIFNAAEYRFYRSNSAPPEESDSPFATNATLPYTPTDTYADGTWYLSCSYFDGIHDSGFLPVGPSGETYLRLDIESGAEVGSPPCGPISWQLGQQAGGVVRVVGLYLDTDTTLRGDEWAIAYTTDGSTPAEDTPDVTVSIGGRGFAVLDYDLPAQSHGTTVKVRLQIRRNDGTDETPDWVYSEDSEVETTTADATGPSVPLGGVPWG